MDMDWENYSRMRKSNGERQRTNSYRTQSYIDGNTVYKTDALPKRREREETTPKKKLWHCSLRLPMRRKIMKVTIRRSQILLTLQKFMKKQRRS